MALALNTRVKKPAISPEDAATLILVRFDGDLPRILMGQRHEAHVFMPNKFVFPGGRLEKGDKQQRVKNFSETTVEKLLVQMRPKPSKSKACGLLVAAIRETFEETGLLVGRSVDDCYANLSGLIYFARAITPPGRSHRFDSRFFVANSDLISNLDQPASLDSPELLLLKWVTMAEALKLDLPSITRDILGLLQPYLELKCLPQADCPVSFHRSRGKAWVVDIVSHGKT
jgi:8-oxo-dGTP pyrophosphatase MutT (NUDIX family)